MPLRGDLIILSELLNQIYPIGAVIHSTTLSTEIDVINQFGGTHWIQHTEYFLRGGDTVTPGQAQSDGGSDNAVVVSHAHTASSAGAGGHTHTANSAGSHSHGTNNATPNGDSFGVYGGGGAGGWGWGIAGTNNNYGRFSIQAGGSHTHGTTNPGNHTHTITVNSNGDDGTNKNIPAYKSVYIWERVS